MLTLATGSNHQYGRLWQTFSCPRQPSLKEGASWGSSPKEGVLLASPLSRKLKGTIMGITLVLVTGLGYLFHAMPTIAGPVYGKEPQAQRKTSPSFAPATH